MKNKKGLSGIFFRIKTEDGFENITFEDLSEDQQIEVLYGKTSEWVKSLAIALANTINQLSEVLDDFSSHQY